MSTLTVRLPDECRVVSTVIRLKAQVFPELHATAYT